MLMLREFEYDMLGPFEMLSYPGAVRHAERPQRLSNAGVVRDKQCRHCVASGA